MNNTRQKLRNEIRARRQLLTAWQQRRASQAILERLRGHPLFINSRHIAFYLANDGEIDPGPLMLLAQQAGKHCYLPVIRPDLSLRFARYRPGDPLQKNRYGIAEPCGRRGHIHRKNLDIVMMPLVAFDREGGRLGMGGGFYDRSLPTAGAGRLTNKPLLMGLAHAFQEVEQLQLEAWDTRLEMIVTDNALIRV